MVSFLAKMCCFSPDGCFLAKRCCFSPKWCISSPNGVFLAQEWCFWPKEWFSGPDSGILPKRVVFSRNSGLGRGLPGQCYTYSQPGMYPGARNDTDSCFCKHPVATNFGFSDILVWDQRACGAGRPGHASVHGGGTWGGGTRGMGYGVGRPWWGTRGMGPGRSWLLYSPLYWSWLLYPHCTGPGCCTGLATVRVLGTVPGWLLYHHYCTGPGFCTTTTVRVLAVNPPVVPVLAVNPPVVPVLASLATSIGLPCWRFTRSWDSMS